MSPIQKFYTASSAPYKTYSQIFNSSGTWTCPVGTTELNVLAVGGGGGGGGIYYQGSQYGVSGGGGGGGVVKKTIPVTPGTSYNVFVGAGGSGGDLNFPGQIGGFSAFNPSYTLINGILQQPQVGTGGDRGNNRYYSNVTGSLSSPPSFSNSSMSITSATTFYSYHTNTKNNTNTSNGNMSRSWNIGTSSSQYGGTYYWAPVSQGKTYTASAYFSVNGAGSPTAEVRIQWYTSLYGSLISSSVGSQVSFNTGWTRASASGTAPSGATYALIRFGHAGSSSTCYLTGAQFEEGSLSAYKTPGFNAPAGSTVIQNFGLVSEASDSVIAQGGGGGQSVSQNFSGWNGSTYSFRPEYSGAGGGMPYITGTSIPMLGGNGVAYNGLTGAEVSLHVSNYTVTDASISNNSPYAIKYEGIGIGQPSYYNTSNVGILYANGTENGYDGIYGFGGMGGRYTSIAHQNSSPNTVGIDGRSSFPNTGNGGSGVSFSGDASNAIDIPGGNGSSGKVILEWMGQA